MDVVDRARADIGEGRLWKAKDRLTGALRGQPSDQRILNLLGEVCYEMGDFPEAGKYWYLTERHGPEMEVALGALHARYGVGSGGLANALPVRADLTEFPEPVTARLRLIVEQHSHLRFAWCRRTRRSRPAEPSGGLWARLRKFAVMTAVLALTVGVWVLGALQIVRLMFRGA